MSPSDLRAEERLKAICQERDKALFERLAAGLLERLLDVTFAIAGSGFQAGGDAGTSGREGRRLRVECKRYSDTTSLDRRELLGEIDHALRADPALEAWVLAATCPVSEQVEQDLLWKANETGVPILIVDWKPGSLGALAALCTSAPDLVASLLGPDAGEIARELQPVAEPAVARLKRELQAWSLGFETLRARAIKKLEDIWSSRQASNAALGQNAAVGAQPKRVRRAGVHQALSSWLKADALKGVPAAIVGLEGVGKTWAAVDWLYENRHSLPIILTLSASCAVGAPINSDLDVKQFIAARLHELTGVEDVAHWVRRLERLLQRPLEEGAVLTVLIDGLNQHPSVEWVRMLQVLQGHAFHGRAQIAFTTRPHYWENRLRQPARLVTQPLVITVDVYDASPGGELDRMLEFEGLDRSQLAPDVLERARVPRLFGLITQLRTRLVEPGSVTVHRLLWEYGRGTLCEKAFSEDEWQEWLLAVARRYRDGLRSFSLHDLSQMASRPDLGPQEVRARLSEIVDGHLANKLPNGERQFRPELVDHALGAALLHHLNAAGGNVGEQAAAALDQWLDPIAGFDERAEILRAAVSISLEIGLATSPVASVLVTAWLQTQNLLDRHGEELKSLAPELVTALLDAIERSGLPSQASAQWWAANALRSINRRDAAAMKSIMDRVARWFRLVSRDVVPLGHQEFESRRSAQLVSRIGIDQSIVLKVIGCEVELVDSDDGDLQELGVGLLEGFPLAPAAPVFEAAAVGLAIQDQARTWGALRWLCLLNEVDPQEARDALRQRSASIRSRVPEQGISAALPARAERFLLWLAGDAEDELEASRLNPGDERRMLYGELYLSNPSRSFFPLERRHAADAMVDGEVALRFRANRAEGLTLDPSFEAPEPFIQELREVASRMDVGQIYRGLSRTGAELDLEQLLTAFARFAPDALRDLLWRKLQSVDSTAAPESLFRVAVEITEHVLLLTPEERSSVAKLATAWTDRERGRGFYATWQFLMVDLVGRPFLEQATLILESGVHGILLEACKILGKAGPEDARQLVARYGKGPREQRRLLVMLFARDSIAFNPETADWLEHIAFGPDEELARHAFCALASGLPAQFGRTLESRHWRWSAGADHGVNHLGTGALIEATLAVPFGEIVSRLAPWRLLEAARRRGGKPPEVRLAGEALGVAIGLQAQAPEHVSTITVDTTRVAGAAFTVSVVPPEDTNPSPQAVWSRFKDPESAVEALNAASAEEGRRVRETRASGAGLYLIKVTASDLAEMIDQDPGAVDRWLDGMEASTTEFVRRVRLAEYTYMSLCEVLLTKMPARGAALWRVLRATFEIGFVGLAGVDELVHVVFRAPDGPAVEALREELLSLPHCHTDQGLMDLALAAGLNGKASWLHSVIDRDKASGLAWRRLRASVLEGFLPGSTLPVPDAWKDGEVLTSEEELLRLGARRQLLDACAEHWWRRFWTVEDPMDAYAAWILVTHAADRRAHRWMRAVEPPFGPSWPLRWEHWMLNERRLRDAIKKREKKLERQFLERSITEALGPWRRAHA